MMRNLLLSKKIAVFLIVLAGLLVLAVNANAINYYSKSSGNLNLTATWGTNTDGTGTSPGNFTTSGNVFYIHNNSTPTINASWTVSGIGSKVVVGDGTTACNFTVGGALVLTATVDISTNGTLTLSTTGALTGITFGTLANGSTVNYAEAGAQTGIVATYSNLTLSGSGIKTFSNFTSTTVNGILSLEGTATVTVTTGAVNYGTNATLQYKTTANRNPTTEEWPSTFSATGGVIIDNPGINITVNANRTIANGSRLTLMNGSLVNGTTNGTRITMNSNSTIYRLEGTLAASPNGTGIYDVYYYGNTKTAGAELGGSGLRNVYIDIDSNQILQLNANRTPDGDINITSGTFDLSTFTINRSSAGGVFSMAAGTTLLVGASNFPGNYSTDTLDPTSNVNYDNNGAQNVTAVGYGNLILSGSGAKSIPLGTSVLGNLNIAPPTSSATASIASGQNIAVGSLTLGSVGKACGTWGSTSSSAINKDNTYFATTTGFVTVGNQPTVYSITGGGSYCAGGSGVAIGLSDSEAGVTYQLYRDVSSVVGSPVSGTGSAITFGNQTEEGTYTAVATRTSGGCNANMTGSVSVIINPFPSAAGSISGSSSVVQGQSSVSYSVGAITNANSYTWAYSGTGATINGTTNSVTITFASNATGGNLTVYGLNSCGNGTVSAAFPITVNSPTECAYSENTSSTIIFVPCINMTSNPETVSSTFISHQYFLLNVIKGLSYQIYTCNTPSQKLKMAIYEEGNASGSVIASSTSNTGNTCNSNVNNVYLSFTSPISGQVRVLINSIADCSDASITGLTVNVNVSGGDNTQDDPNAAGTDSWIGHIYDGASFNNYLGYYSQTETFQESFDTGGTWPDNTNDDATCFYSINSNGTARASLKDVSFSARYLMNSSKHGLYRADMTGDDGDRLLVDGVQVYSDWSDHSPRTTSDVLFSLSGNSTLAFEYYENGGQNVCGFNNLVQVLANNLSTNTTQSICVGTSGSEISGDVFGTLPSGISLSGTGYQWTYSTTPGGVRANITGATGATFTPNASLAPFNTAGTYYLYRNAILSSTNNVSPNPYIATNESNAATVNVSSPTTTPTVSIAASPGATICTGTSVTYTATSVNTSGGAVNYDFKINGNSQQSTSSNTFTTSTLTNGNLVTCEITITGGTCLTSNTATSNTVTMTVNPSTGVPVFTAGATSVCQNDPDGTYTATAANSTALTYSVLPISAGSINTSTGVMNWSASFSGTATITATATGLCGTTSSDRIVTVNPLPPTGEIVGD